MLFQTYEFLVLMLIVLFGVILLRRARWQQWMLLVASYVFYGWWDVRFLILILFSSLLDHTVALGISGVGLSRRRRLWYSVIALAGVWLFLGCDWPALQHAHSLPSLSEFLRPSWEGARAAVAACAGVVLVFNLAYVGCSRLGETGRRRAFLSLSIIGNLGMLAFFKYYNFFIGNLVGIGQLLGSDWEPKLLSIALPVGISFYTFQTMSYTIDVYRGLLRPERSLHRTMLYVAYFPQLVAGPILRPSQFLPSLDAAWVVRPDNLRRGVNLAAVGLFKKVLIADRVGPLVNTILADPMGQSSAVIVLASVLFAVQIYCDFSGYTDIARGISRVFGVEIPLNFNFPYFSTSIIEFWRRWHISLSTWLRDYLYIPLGGNRKGWFGTYGNIMITMGLGGLWHGAAWNFVIWGAYQGVLLCLNRLLRSLFARMPRVSRLLESRGGTVFRWAVTMYFTLLGWLIFRVQNFDHLWHCMKKFVLFDGRLMLSNVGLGRGSPFLAVMAMLAFVVLHTMGRFGMRWDERLNRLSEPMLLLVYALIGLLLFVGWPQGNEPFIYFQF